MMSDKLRAAALAALDAMSVVRVFVTTEEKIKHPEGTDWYDNIRINLDDSIVNDIKEMNALEAALAEQEYICKCGIRVTPHRCKTDMEF